MNIREQIASIIGVETTPDGFPEHYLIRDGNGQIVQGIDFRPEIDELEALLSSQLQTPQGETEARIDENQRYLDRIEAFKNRIPEPGELTAESFGRGGAGMVESAYENSFKKRISELRSPTKEEIK
jgi:hypothetical protein